MIQCAIFTPRGESLIRRSRSLQVTKLWMPQGHIENTDGILLKLRASLADTEEKLGADGQKILPLSLNYAADKRHGNIIVKILQSVF